MKNLNHLNKYRVPFLGGMGDKHNGAFKIRKNGMNFVILASNGGDWEHVSISTSSRCPKWEEMCYFKELFFNDDEVVVQYHPAKSEYVNNHQFCLHLWKPTSNEIPTPPSIYVGVKGLELA